MVTVYAGGRCKTREYRHWALWTVCFCRGGKHKSPHPKFKWSLDKGNPMRGVDWYTTCPLACWEFLQSFEEAKDRRYPKVSKDGANLTPEKNEGDIVNLAINWMVSQGVCPANSPYSHNSGRIALGRLLSAKKIPYEIGFEIHGDKWQNWQGYQPDCKYNNFDRRKQSRHPDIACKPLRLIANYFGLGVRVKPPKTKEEKLMHRSNVISLALLRHLPGGAEAVKQIERGLDNESSDSDIEPLVLAKRKKKQVTPFIRPSAIVANASDGDSALHRVNPEPSVPTSSSSYAPNEARA